MEMMKMLREVSQSYVMCYGVTRPPEGVGFNGTATGRGDGCGWRASFSLA